jgi:glutamate 5-kinase
VPTPRRLKGRKKWMAFNPRTEGAIVVDRGAERALLKQGRSLLPAGVKAVQGDFSMGGVISILDEDGHELARGLSNFSSKDLEKIRGLNTKKIPDVLGGEAYFDEVVHRDNLVIVAQAEGTGHE